MTPLLIITVGIGGLLLGLLLGYVFTRQSWSTRLQISREATLRAEAQCDTLAQKLEQEKQHRDESLNLLRSSYNEQQKDIEARFEALSSKILETNTRQLKSDNKEQMDSLLTPLKQQLEGLGKAVQQTNTNSATHKASLELMLNRMLEQTQRLDAEAANLTKALRGDSKKQGDWGEMILERMLEESGLRKDEEYYTQQTYKADDGRAMRPDVVVRLPDKRCVIIDSKVSLTAYAAYTAAEDETEQRAYLTAHVASVRKHMDELAAKEYGSLVQDAVGYVLMFIPNEASYIAAVQAAPELPLEGYRKRVLIISPTNLLMALQLAHNLWQKERQTQNVEAIFKKAAAIYDKCVGLTQSFQDVGKNLQKAMDAHDEAMRRFNSGKGNLTRQVEDLRQMGISTSKRLELSDDGEPD